MNKKAIVVVMIMAVIGIMILSGCVEQEPVIPPTPEPTPMPKTYLHAELRFCAYSDVPIGEIELSRVDFPHDWDYSDICCFEPSYSSMLRDNDGFVPMEPLYHMIYIKFSVGNEPTLQEIEDVLGDNFNLIFYPFYDGRPAIKIVEYIRYESDSGYDEHDTAIFDIGNYMILFGEEEECKFKVGDQVVVPIPRTLKDTEPIIGNVTDITLSCEMLVEDIETGEDMWFSQNYCFPYDSQKRYFVMPIDMDNETRMMFFIANASQFHDIELTRFEEIIVVEENK